MRIIKQETLTEIINDVGSEAMVTMGSIFGLLEEFDPLSVPRPIGKSGRPTKYPFRDMAIDDARVILFDDKKDVKRAKCAANTLTYLHGLKFDVKSRENDAGKFELTVKRVG